MANNSFMATPRQVIYDSDDDDDYEVLVDPMTGLPADAPCDRPTESGSTGPSFFRSVYEQHRDIPRRPVAEEQPTPDMWEVPSSPQRPPSRLSTKRKRVDDLAPEAASHAGAQRFQVVIDLGGQEQDDAGGAMGDGTGSVYPPSTALTESTIAYPTPSRFASSGPRYVESSKDDVAGQIPDQVPVRLPDLQPTPPRQRREVLLPSSPDEIAEPAPFGQTSLYGDASEPPPRSTARKKRRSSDADELAPDLGRQSARQKDSNFVCIDSTDDEESMPIIPATETTITEPAAAPKKKRGRKAKIKETADGSDAPETLPAASKPKRPRGRPKQKPVAVKETPPLENPTEAVDELPDTTLCEASGNAGRANDELRGPDKEMAQDNCSPSRVDKQLSPPPDAGQSDTAKAAANAAPVPAPAPTKKPISAIGSSQGRVPFRVGLSKKHRIAPLLKTVPKQ